MENPDFQRWRLTMLRIALLLAALAAPAHADPEGYGHMMNWGYGFGMLFGSVLWLLVLALIVAAVIWFVRGMDNQPGQKRSTGAIAELDMRFARGEIDAEEYEARKKLLVS